MNSSVCMEWLKESPVPRKTLNKILVLDGQASHCNWLQMLEFARNNYIVIFGYILTLPSIYNSLRGHFQDLERVKLCCRADHCSVLEKCLHDNWTFSSKIFVWSWCNKHYENVGKLKKIRSKEECCCDKEHGSFYFITILFITVTLLSISLNAGHLSPLVCRRCPFAFIDDLYCRESTRLQFL